MLVTSIIGTTIIKRRRHGARQGSSRALGHHHACRAKGIGRPSPITARGLRSRRNTGLQSGHRLRFRFLRRAASYVEVRTVVQPSSSAASNCPLSFAARTEPPRLAATFAMPPPAAFGRDFGQEIQSGPNAEPQMSCSNRSQSGLWQRWRGSVALAAHANIGRVPVASIAPRHLISKMTARTAKVNLSPAAIVARGMCTAGGDLGTVVLSSAAVVSSFKPRRSLYHC